MSLEKYKSLFRHQSDIFNPPEPGPMNTFTPVLPGNRNSLETKKSGVVSVLKAAETGLKSLERKFLLYQKDRLNQGHQKPTSWPPDLTDEKDRLEAHIQIYTEEIEYLDRLLADVETVEKIERERKEPCLGKIKDWNRQVLKDEVLFSVAGQLVESDSEGFMHISDARSPYKGMAVWRWKSAVWKPAVREYNRRWREMMKLPEHEREDVKYPPAPLYHSDSDSIEYIDIADSILVKLGLK